MTDETPRLYQCVNCEAPLYGAPGLKCSQCGHLHEAGQEGGVFDPATGGVVEQLPADLLSRESGAETVVPAEVDPKYAYDPNAPVDPKYAYQQPADTVTVTSSALGLEGEEVPVVDAAQEAEPSAEQVERGDAGAQTVAAPVGVEEAPPPASPAPPPGFEEVPGAPGTYRPVVPA